MKKLTFLFLLLILSCKHNAAHFVDYIEGYWEIERVTKNGHVIKEFKISTGIDYFKINTDLSGFRKKVKPNFQGTYETSKDVLNFKLKIENNHLFMVYNNKSTTYFEEITKASDSTLVISNSEGFAYHYKAFKPLNFNE